MKLIGYSATPNNDFDRIAHMRYRLRTLLIVLTLGPMVLAGTFFLLTSPEYLGLRFALLDFITFAVFLAALAALWEYWPKLTKWL
jgi:hypothetical protein